MRIVWIKRVFTKQKVWCPICEATLKVDARDVIERRKVMDGVYGLRFKCKHCKREFEIGEPEAFMVGYEFVCLNNKASEYKRD